MVLKNIIKFFITSGLFLSFVFAQADPTNQGVEQNGVNKIIEPSVLGGGPAVGFEGAVKMSNILINDFEQGDSWFGAMSIDSGLVQVEKRRGAPREIRESKPDKGKFVLGTKVHFFRAGFTEASVEPPNPILVPGLTHKLTVWVYGRGYRHMVSAIVRDFKGRTFKFPFGEVNFYGWRKMEANIPHDPSWPFFSQQDVTKQSFYQTHGITFLAFFVDFNPKDSFGRFYIYFDELVAESNVYTYEQELEVARTPDDERLDPVDNW